MRRRGILGGRFRRVFVDGDFDFKGDLAMQLSEPANLTVGSIGFRHLGFRAWEVC